MTVTLVCDIFGEENNGTSVATMNLMRYLKKSGYTVRVLCADQTMRGKENFFVVSNRSFGKKLDALVEKIGVSLAKPDKETVSAALTGADHVHVMFPLELGMAAVKAARAMGLPITVGFHMQAENFTGYLKLNGVRFANTLVYKFIYNRVYRYADAVHYPTAFIRGVFESRTGRTTNGYVISNGVHSYIKKRETPKPEEYADKTVILCTGRYAAEKSQDTLIKAVKRSKYKDSIQLIFAGQGLKEKRYKRLAADLPVQPVFRLYSRDEMVDVINYCDMYVHPAVVELEGIACLESIACGKLTIVSNSKKSATKDFALDGKCIFRKRSAKDLARVLDYWIERPDEREEYGLRYLESGIAADVDKCMEKMVEMIETTAAKKQANKVKYELIANFTADGSAFACDLDDDEIAETVK